MTAETAKSPTVHMASFEEGLGRIMYMTGALEYEGRFLAPLHRFLTLHPRTYVCRVPSCVSFVLRCLSEQDKKSCGTTVALQA